MNKGQLDAWITGNHGEDHPDNVEEDQTRCPWCDRPMDGLNESCDVCDEPEDGTG